MRVEEFVERALYGPDGFYETGGRAGRRGASFVTSVETGPLFGAVVAQAIDAWWRAAGEPAEWVVVDAGAGPGTLARTIRAAAPACTPALRLVNVERSTAQRALHDPADTSTDELPAEADVIVAGDDRPVGGGDAAHRHRLAVGDRHDLGPDQRRLPGSADPGLDGGIGGAVCVAG